MNPIIVFGLIQGLVTLVSKFMDGKKTKAGVGMVVAGSAVSAVSLWGVDVTPDQIVYGLQQVLALFGYQMAGDVEAAAQMLFGNLLSAIGAGLALYGYQRKGQLVSKR